MYKSLLVKELDWEKIFIAICIGGTIGIALKFAVLLDTYVYFPFFPNILDAIFLIVSVCFLGYKIKRKN